MKPKDLDTKQKFRTGSSLVRGVEPNDNDIVVLYTDQREFTQLLIDAGGLDEADLDHASVSDYGRFVTFMDGNINYICTWDEELFYRFKAFSGALDLLQPTDKDARVKLSKACLYWEDSMPFENYNIEDEES